MQTNQIFRIVKYSESRTLQSVSKGFNVTRSFTVAIQNRKDFTMLEPLLNSAQNLKKTQDPVNCPLVF